MDIFKPEDFARVKRANGNTITSPPYILEALAAQANQVFREWLESQPRVGHQCRQTARGTYVCWHERGNALWCTPKRRDTHTARLVDIQPIIKEPK